MMFQKYLKPILVKLKLTVDAAINEGEAKSAIEYCSLFLT